MEKPPIVLINSPSLAAKEKHYERPRYPRLSIAYLAGYLRAQGIHCLAIDAKYEGVDSSLKCNFYKFI